MARSSLVVLITGGGCATVLVLCWVECSICSFGFNDTILVSAMEGNVIGGGGGCRKFKLILDVIPFNTDVRRLIL